MCNRDVIVLWFILSVCPHKSHVIFTVGLKGWAIVNDPYCSVS